MTDLNSELWEHEVEDRIREHIAMGELGAKNAGNMDFYAKLHWLADNDMGYWSQRGWSYE